MAYSYTIAGEPAPGDGKVDMDCNGNDKLEASDKPEGLLNDASDQGIYELQNLIAIFDFMFLTDGADCLNICRKNSHT